MKDSHVLCLELGGGEWHSEQGVGDKTSCQIVWEFVFIGQILEFYSENTVGSPLRYFLSSKTLVL